MFPNKCKDIANEKDVTRYIADDLEISSDDLYKENSVEKDYKGYLSVEKIILKCGKTKTD